LTDNVGAVQKTVAASVSVVMETVLYAACRGRRNGGDQDISAAQHVAPCSSASTHQRHCQNTLYSCSAALL